MRVRAELAALLVEPALFRLIAQVLPDRFRIPVLRFLRDEVSPLENQNARGGIRERVRHGAAARAAADDDDVIVVAPAHHAVGRSLEYTSSIRR
jgi:hypothetical protein